MSTIKIENGIYWVGSNDEKASLNCNPYLIIDVTVQNPFMVHAKICAK